MSSAVINVGQTYIDDDGDQVTVRKIRRSQGVVVLEGEDGTCEMSLDALEVALEDGEFEEVEDDDAETDDEDDD
jgi:Fe-S cluster biogenesis protein NfuA